MVRAPHIGTLSRRFLLAASLAIFAAPSLAAVNRQEYPYPREAVYQAMVSSLAGLRYKVKQADPVIFRVVASAGMSATSFGEDFSLAVIDLGGGRSAIEYASTRKLGTNIADFGRGQKIFNKVVLDVSQRLQASGTARAPAP